LKRPRMASISLQLAPSSFTYILTILNQYHHRLVVESKFECWWYLIW
jgi:predicted O-linked N-acetylglucosamine transferase (SPINDLY family)